MTLNDLKLRARALLRPNRVEQELEEELAFHIEREARKLIDEGMTPAEARRTRAGALRIDGAGGRSVSRRARYRGHRQHHSRRSVRVAAFAKAPLAAFTIVVTVAIGLGVVAVLFTVLNTLIFRVDQVPDIGEMYAVERTQLANGDGSLLTRPMFDAMRADTHVFTDAYATVPEIIFRSTAGGWRSRSSPGIFPGRSGQSGHGPRPHAGRRCAFGRQRGDRAEPQGVGSAFQS
jgi:hypothetical protein